jgi:hypothetical protein
MAGSHPEVISKQKNWQALGDWLAPVIALVSVTAVLLAFVSSLFESVR